MKINDENIIGIHYQLLRTQLILEHLLSNLPSEFTDKIKDELYNIDEEAIEKLKKIYPKHGVTKIEKT